jgi:hypothetical protein
MEDNVVFTFFAVSATCLFFLFLFLLDLGLWGSIQGIYSFHRLECFNAFLILVHL